MQQIVLDKPYVFSPPYPGVRWPRFLQMFAARRLRRDFGIIEVDLSGLEHLEQSRRAGHGILLAPNHCRPADPFVISELSRRAGIVPHVMASAHLFMQGSLKGRFQAWLLSRAGVFSVYREGMDKQAVTAAIDILRKAERPLVIFPEGVISRSNDRLNALMEGTTFIARGAAKKRAEGAADSPSKVVVHPVAIRYLFRGDIKATLEPTLEELEVRLTWRPQRQLPLVDRITKIGAALLSLKEIEFLGEPHNGTTQDRVDRLINHLLVPLEQEWLQGKSEGTVVGRVKKLRAAVLPGMIQREKGADPADAGEEKGEAKGGEKAGEKPEITPEERERRWRQLADMYLAQQLSCYPPDYLKSNPTPERMLETVERFEEDLTDRCRRYAPMTAKVRIGEPIVVSPARQRGAAEDPVLSALEHRLDELIAGLKS